MKYHVNELVLPRAAGALQNSRDDLGIPQFQAIDQCHVVALVQKPVNDETKQGLHPQRGLHFGMVLVL